MQLRCVDAGDVRVLEMRPGTRPDGLDGFVVFLLDAATGAHLTAVEDFADRDGDFLTAARGVGESTVAVIPHGAAARATGRVLARVVWMAGDEALGISTFELPAQPDQAYDRGWVMRPLVAMALSVARADGGLNRPEVAAIREGLRAGLELEGHDLEVLRQVMKASHDPDPEAHVIELAMRLPHIEEESVLSFLAQVALSDGALSDAELAALRKLGDLLWDEGGWEGFAASRGLLPETGSSDAEAFALFDLDPGASAESLRRAYREKMKAYHPDRVSHLPEDFQRLAHEKSLELQRAYERLARIVS
jgi:DnaJ like chaperone protein